MLKKTVAQTSKIKDDQLIQKIVCQYIPAALQQTHTEILAEQTIQRILQPANHDVARVIKGLHQQPLGFADRLITNYQPQALSKTEISSTLDYLKELLKKNIPNLDNSHLKSVLGRRDTLQALQQNPAPILINNICLIHTINRLYAKQVYNTPKPITVAEEANYIRLLQIGLLIQPHCIPTDDQILYDVIFNNGHSFPVIPKYLTGNKVALPLFMDKRNYISGSLNVPTTYLQQAGTLGEVLLELIDRYIKQQSIFSSAITGTPQQTAMRLKGLEPIDGYLASLVGVALLEQLIRRIAQDQTTKKIFNVSICTSDPGLKQSLEPLFRKDEMSIRDALAHGLHGMWQNPKIFNYMLGRIMNAINLLNSKYPVLPLNQITNSIAPVDLSFAKNFLVQNNILTLIDSPAAFLQTISNTYKQLSPDKLLLGQGLLYLYFSLQKSSKAAQPVSPTEVLVNTLAAFTFFEEVLRAKATACNLPIMIVAGPKNDRLYPEYKMLDTTCQGLLEPTIARQLLGTLTTNEQAALDILRRFRDALLHGETYDITELFCAAHLAMYFTAKLV